MIHILMRGILICLGLFSFSMFLRVINDPSHPKEIYFEEKKILNITKSYLRKEYYFDIDPPFGKLLTTWLYKIIFRKWIDILDSLRILSIIFNSLIPLVFFAICDEMRVKLLWNVCFSIMICLDNSFISLGRSANYESLSILLFLVLFYLQTKYSTVSYHKNTIFLLLSSYILGLLISTKLIYVFLVFPHLIIVFKTNKLRKSIYSILISIGIIISVVLLVYYIHFMSLTKPGPGCSYHSGSFCKKLSKNRKFNRIRESYKLFLVQIKYMFSNKSFTYIHSMWFKWPFMLGRKTNLYQSNQKGIWCVGSPVFYFSSFFGFISETIISIIRFDHKKYFIIVLVYIFSFIPYSLISMYSRNFEYIPSLLITSILSGVFFNSYFSNSIVIPSTILVLSLIAYIVQFPITYGTINKLAVY